MNTHFEAIGVRQLRDRTGELESLAAQHRTLLLTKNGNPLYFSLPFDGIALTEGTQRALAIRLFEMQALSRGAAARLAKLSIDAFMQLASRSGVAVLDMDDQSLQQDLNTFG